jgi:hypothetical protein
MTFDVGHYLTRELELWRFGSRNNTSHQGASR